MSMPLGKEVLLGWGMGKRPDQLRRRNGGTWVEAFSFLGVAGNPGTSLGGTRGSEGRGRARGRGAPCPSPAPGPPGSRGGREKTWAPGLGSAWWSRSRCRPRSAGPSGPRHRPLSAPAARVQKMARIRLCLDKASEILAELQDGSGRSSFQPFLTTGWEPP